MKNAQEIGHFLCQLKWTIGGDVNFLFGYGVGERYRLGVKVQSVGMCAVEHIAHDRRIKSVGVRGVYSQLVCATGYG